MEQAKLMQLSYDETSDILYLSLGEPRRAISRELGDDIVLRLDEQTGEVVGLTVLNLSKHQDLTHLPLEMTLRQLA